MMFLQSTVDDIVTLAQTFRSGPFLSCMHMHFIAEDSFRLLYDLYSIQRLFFLIFTKGANGVS